MSDFSHFNNIEQAKPLLKAIALELPKINEQVKQLYNKQNEIADHYQQEIEAEATKAEEEINKLKADFRELTENYENQIKEKDKEIEAKKIELNQKNEEIELKGKQIDTYHDRLIEKEKTKEDLEKG